MYTQKNKQILVRDVMLGLNRVPLLSESTIFKMALEEMGSKRLGIACVVNDQGNLSGIITDGDIRRKLLKVQKPFAAMLVDDAIDHAIRFPTTTSPNDSLFHAITIMENKQVWDLPVVDDDGLLIGLLHLHPAIKMILEVDQ
jgi:arabinose-5-phosphate isomerase